ncbi:class I adenylate-forming enzyme family protein [Kutzneria buriramensis]|uniref:Long-chain acyl-CoA synthetase n=1 Tax=Kutzneria buriramensis TaxID=1045776 RepID=A0A3E0HLU8_9PSEU|nr:class I adenylate-forming enzyme family protein [Kutzneria buriramensis]REH47186.1 long-chain acyl-CoA synthetase [Kutzneria buriramensis]
MTDGYITLGGRWHKLMRRAFAGRGLWIGEIFHNAARRHGSTTVELDRPLACVSDDRLVLTVADLAEIVDELAARLWAAGVRPGDRLAIHKTDNFDIALLACAAARIGGVPAMLSPALDGDVVGKLLIRIDQPWLITDAETLDGKLADERVTEKSRGVLLSSGGPRPGTVSLAAHAGAATPAPVRQGLRAPMLVTHSSGTTGVPKLAVHCPEGLWHRVAPQKIIAWPIRGRDKAFLSMTLVHTRFYMALEMFLSRGNPMVIAVDPDPASIGPLLVKTRPGFLETHPNTFVDWEVLADAPGSPLGGVRYFHAAFDAIHPRTMANMLNASKRRNPLFFRFYGQSEIGPVSGHWYTRRSAPKAAGQCVGFRLFGFISMRVVDDAGRPQRPGGHGHIEVRGPSEILTYLGEEDRYAREVHDGWWRMGDMGYLDRLGRLYLLDREVDQIESLPSNLEVEDVLMSRLHELREVVVVADGEGRPVPVIATRDERPLPADRWADAVRDMPAMAPVVHAPYQQLPYTATRKIRRSELSRRLAAGLIDDLSRTVGSHE